MSVHRRTTRTTRRPAGWALLTTAALVLTGCTDDPAPTPSDAATTSTEATPATPDPTEDPAPQPPERPAAMDGTDEEAAKAAAGYFLELYTYTLQSGDPSAWKEVSDLNCQACKLVVADVERYAADEERYQGGEITWTEQPRVITVAGTDGFEIRYEVEQAEGEIVDSKGAVTSRFSASNMTLSIFVYRDEGWVLFNMAVGE